MKTWPAQRVLPAAAVAALLAAAIVMGILLLRPVPPPAVPTAPPPAGVSLFYVYDPHNTAELDAYDWGGRPRGMVPVPHELTLHHGGDLFASPDGSSFVLVHGDASAQWLDRLGRPVAADAMPGFVYRSYMWSADSRGVCRLGVTEADTWELSTVTTADQTRVAARFPEGPDLRPTFYLAACSFADDRALLWRWQSDAPRQNDLVSVTLSTGALTLVSPARTVGYEASPTGAVIAENSSGPDGGPISHLHPLGSESDAVDVPFGVSMFSGDGSMAMAGNGSAVLDWRHGRVVWRNGAGSFFFYFGQPGGSSFVVATAPKGGCNACSSAPRMAVIIVRRDGSTIRIPDSPLLVVPELPT